MQIIPTLGPNVCKYYLLWAIWIPRVIISKNKTGHNQNGTTFEPLGETVPGKPADAKFGQASRCSCNPELPSDSAGRSHSTCRPRAPDISVVIV